MSVVVRDDPVRCGPAVAPCSRPDACPLSGLVSALRRSCSPTARQRGAVERENGRLKNDWALSPLRVRRIERVRLHAVLTILARLATALAKARAMPLVV